MGGTPDDPGFAILVADDDHTEENPDAEGLAALNHIPIGDNIYVSLQAIANLEAQIIDNGNYGLGPAGDGSFDTRLNIYAGLGFGDRARIYAALKHGERFEDAIPTGPADRDDLDLHMAFAELSFGDLLGGDTGDALLRVGRQELHYGAGRMISIREGPQIRNDWDAAIVRVRSGPVIAEAFGAFEVSDETGVFDNGTSWDEGLWGLYTSTQLGTSTRDSLDFYYIGQRILAAPGIQGLTNETRHFLGARWFRPTPEVGFGWDVEGTLAFGSFTEIGTGNTGDIEAWSLTSELTYARGDWSLEPSLRLRAGYTTGDDDPADDKIGTFRAPAPPGRYFGEFTPIGPGNLFGASAALDLHPTSNWVVSPYVLFFWRAETSDGSYNPPQFLNRGAVGDERFVGWQYNVLTTYTIDQHWSVFGEAGVFEVGDYLRDNPPAEDIAYAKIALQLRF